jgi:hypothetical protein
MTAEGTVGAPTCFLHKTFFVFGSGCLVLADTVVRRWWITTLFLSHYLSVAPDFIPIFVVV